jgi:hypothetical protein
MELDGGQARADVRGPAARPTGFLATALATSPSA